MLNIVTAVTVTAVYRGSGAEEQRLHPNFTIMAKFTFAVLNVVLNIYI